MDIHIRKLPGSIVEQEFYLVSNAEAERAELFNDAMTMALRLYGEDPLGFGPECYGVMQRWLPRVERALKGEEIKP